MWSIWRRLRLSLWMLLKTMSCSQLTVWVSLNVKKKRKLKRKSTFCSNETLHLRSNKHRQHLMRQLTRDWPQIRHLIFRLISRSRKLLKKLPQCRKWTKSKKESNQVMMIKFKVANWMHQNRMAFFSSLSELPRHSTTKMTLNTGMATLRLTSRSTVPRLSKKQSDQNVKTIFMCQPMSKQTLKTWTRAWKWNHLTYLVCLKGQILRRATSCKTQWDSWSTRRWTTTLL